MKKNIVIGILILIIVILAFFALFNFNTKNPKNIFDDSKVAENVNNEVEKNSVTGTVEYPIGKRNVAVNYKSDYFNFNHITGNWQMTEQDYNFNFQTEKIVRANFMNNENWSPIPIDSGVSANIQFIHSPNQSCEERLTSTTLGKLIGLYPVKSSNGDFLMEMYGGDYSSNDLENQRIFNKYLKFDYNSSSKDCYWVWYTVTTNIPTDENFYYNREAEKKMVDEIERILTTMTMNFQ